MEASKHKYGTLPVIVDAKAGREWWILGDATTCKIDGRATGGSHAVFETVTPPGGGTPPHVHRREDETFYVLEGELEFWLDGKTKRVGAGGTVFAPRDIPHCFRNPTDRPVRSLLVTTPAGMEHFFEDLAREVKSLPPPIETVVAVCSRHGIEILRTNPS